jgi:signal transduction histidine kinase
MNAKKQKLLDESFDRVMQVCIYNMDAPLEWIDQYIHPNVSGFGTEADEEIHSREDCRLLILKSREQSSGLDFKATGEVLYKQVSPEEDEVFFVQQIHVHLTVGGEIMQRALRMSLIMRYENGAWRMIHFHGSAPETGTSIEDTFQVEGWKTRMAELEKLVDEKTAALLVRNRELEIEAALEKVRAVAMGMKEPKDMLDMCKVIAEELQRLSIEGIKLVETIVIHHNDDVFLDYEYYGANDYSIVETFRYKENELIQKMVDTILQSENSFYYGGKITGPLKTEWFSFMEQSGYYVAPELLISDEVHYHFYSVGQAALGLVTDHALSDDEMQLYKRLRNVFALAYRRYRDIEKAEEQAKEAKIEAALERVRSAANAMKTSDELLQVITVVGQQLENLGLQFDSTNFRTNVGEKDWCLWIYAKWMDQPRQWFVPHIEHPYFFVQEKQGDVVSSVFTREEKDSFEAYLFQLGLIEIPKDPEVAAKQKAFIESAKGFAWSIAAINSVSLNIANSQAKPYTPEENALLLRFTVVFEQAYTRFLDLQKAEAQAKEAQIEAALERIRAASMAMHNSEQLSVVIKTVTDQLQSLGFSFETANFITNFTDKGFNLWLSVPGIEHPSFVYVPYEDNVFFRFLQQGIALKKDFDTLTGDKEEKDKFFNHFFSKSEAGKIPEERKKYVFDKPGVGFTTAFRKHFYFTIVNYEGHLHSAEENSILVRFANVFEQSYTRFLDLQKAEAQSREAQIELGLERVRARAMAMQHSEELKDLIDTVFTELTRLDIVLTRCLLMIYDPASKGSRWWMANSETQNEPIGLFVKYHEHPPYLAYLQAWETKTIRWQYNLQGQIKKDWDDFLFSQTELSYLPDFVIAGMKAPDSVILTASFNNFGNLTLATLEPLSEEHSDILLRFAKVFDLTYTRFNDLQKAEAQAREAQIEAALERVRSKTMAMHNSEDVGESVVVLFNELTSLGLLNSQARCGIGIMHPDYIMESWTARQKEDKTELSIGYLDLKPHALLRNAYQTWLDHRDSCTYTLEGEDRLLYIDAIRNQTLYNASIEFYAEIDTIFQASFFCAEVSLYVFRLHEITESDKSIFLRFVNVFSQTYRRYKDLQKAEAQAREAQIENALEKVRSRSLAMHSSHELKEVVNAVYERIKVLNIDIDSFTIIVAGENEQEIDYWIANENPDTYPSKISVPRIGFFPEETLVSRDFFNNWTNNINFSKTYSFEEKNAHWLSLFKNSGFKEIEEKRKQFLLSTPAYALSIAFTKNSALVFAKYQEKVYSDNEKNILQRFANVFEQSYIRFLDLKKAEAQAKESKIQLSLERVRAKSLAMHHTSELQEVIQTVHKELLNLDISIDGGSFVVINDDVNEALRCWGAGGTADTSAEVTVPHFNLRFCTDLMNGIRTRAGFFAESFSQAEKKEYFTKLFQHKPWSDLSKEYQKETLSKPGGYTRSVCALQHTSIFIINHYGKVFSEEDNHILIRFANVFEQAYTRFLDLKKAEAQAREAEIQLSLERVRARTMAMQRSEELTDSAKLLIEEFKNLHSEAAPLVSSRGFISIINEPEQKFDLWITDIDGTEIRDFFRIDFAEPTQGRHIYKAWKEKQPHIILDLSGDELTQWLDYLVSIGFPIAPGIYGTRRVNNFIYHSNGFIGITSSQPLSTEGIALLERFARVFDLTYTRFTDLLQSEARARHAVKDASLDRVRAEIASMRNTDDLQRITPVIWRELTSLSIPFIRCGVFIMDEATEQMHCFLSTPEGKSIASFELPFNSEGNISDVLHNWQKRQSYVAQWMRQDFTGIAANLVQQKRIDNEEQYLGTLPADGIHLHFLPFLQGMLYVGNTERLSNAALDLIQSLAEAFSTAYARYEDFILLENAKKEVEKTLTELKQTQQQLVQSEKMASLGELTAGIAHEIQNPLNFVNNFSEVSNELIDEMKEELATGNLQQATEIADDLKENLTKINHHGKRADAIVKGMLQHSRSGSGKKEPVDMNALCDEYLRLAFHGYRAKDKSFNAAFETDFAPALPKVNVMPQDMGRVILNLINNAFYAVNEKAKNTQSDNPQPYQPKVTVSTKRIDNTIEITVADNGNGIPPSAVNKIFQPFFTTKPTGQGTGLGLSLSYDIVKAHGGELELKTEEGNGSSFTIKLLS